MEIYSKMALILSEVDAIKKEKRNTQQNYNFRGIDDMYNALHDLFAKHQVFITSEVLSTEREERTTAKGGNLIYTILQIKFTFWTIDGSNCNSIMIGEAMDSGDKSANKAMSTALKYALMQSFLIPTEELIDSDKDTYEVKPKPEKKEPERKLKQIPEITEKFDFTKWDGLISENKTIVYSGNEFSLSEKAYKQLMDFLDDQEQTLRMQSDNL